MKRFGVLLLVLTVAPVAAQGPDVLIPSGSNDGAYALIDKNGDGKYSEPFECWDYFLYSRNAAPRWFVRLNGRFYFVDPILEHIVTLEDTNANGLIELSERRVFFNYARRFAGHQSPTMITLDNQGWMWCVNADGDDEGIYRHKDLNNDGDAEDVGELVEVLSENQANIGISNTPRTSGNPAVLPVLAMTDLEYIHFDGPYNSGNGRFFLEDELSDQTIALEDKNGDGDFRDPGEVYLFCALSFRGSIKLDVNPDVTNNVIPGADEISVIDQDLAGRYYLMSGKTLPIADDAGIIFRGIDANSDGDINDAGEVKIYWDGSVNGAGIGYNHLNGMYVGPGGRIYATAEWNDAVDHERLLLITDMNNDGDANDPGETEVLWDMPTDRVIFRPAIFQAGTIKPLVGKTTVAEIDYYGAATCRTSLSGTSVQRIQYGWVDNVNGGSSKPPVIGNNKWLLRTWGNRPSTQAGWALGLTKFGSGISLDNAGTCKLYHSAEFLSFPFMTNIKGAKILNIKIPNAVALVGLRTYWQSFVYDVSAPGGLGITTSRGMEVKFGDYSYTK